MAIPCTTMAVTIRNDQSETFTLIRIGVSSRKIKGIDTASPTTFEYKVIASGSTLLERSLVTIISIAKVIIVTTIHHKPLSICIEDIFPFATTKKIPMIATIDPSNIRIVNFSFKKTPAKTPVKMGVVAKINADVVGSAVSNPAKKDHWLIKTPKTPKKLLLVNHIYSIVSHVIYMKIIQSEKLL